MKIYSKAKFKKQLYNRLITSNRYILHDYSKYKLQTNKQSNIKRYQYMLYLNWKYRILKRPFNDDEFLTAENNKFNNDELYGLSPEEVVDKLLPYDIISFDIFYTLLFRPFLGPEDFFDILAVKYNIVEFKTIRINAERKAHERSTKLNSEANIFDIYKIIEKETGIPLLEGVENELALENEFLIANNYMLEIFRLLKAKNKRIIATSDMYFPKKYLETILEQCGYSGFENIFISCDWEARKWNGSLYPIIRAQLGMNTKYVHIGDNYQHDILNARENGWSAFYYPNIHNTSIRNMPTYTFSLCQGLINVKFGRTDKIYNQHYRFGYEYGGRLVVGFCQWLEKLACQQQIDKFLFLSRDGDIISKIYNKFFGTISNDYVFFSRFITNELSFDKYIEDFFDYNIRNRAFYIRPKQTLKSVLEETDLVFLVSLLKQSHLSENDKLDEHNCEAFCEFIYSQKELVAERFKETQIAAKKYFDQVIGTCQRICLVDVGWRGSSTVYFKEFINRVCSKKLDIVGALVATSNNHYTEVTSTAGINHAYLFSPEKNRDLLLMHNQEFPVLHNNFVELIFSSEQSSFLKFELDKDKNVKYIFAPNEGNQIIVKAIQKGILDFAADYFRYVGKSKIYNISPYDTYIPIYESFKNTDYYYNLFKNFNVSITTSSYGSDDSKFLTLGEFMKQEGYI